MIDHEAVVQRCHGQRETAGRVQEVCKAGARRRLQTIFSEEPGEGFPPPGGFGDQQNAASETVDEGLQTVEGVLGPAVNGQRWQAVHRPVVAGGDVHPGVGLGGDEKGFLGQEEIRRWQQRVRPVAGEHRVARLRLTPEGANRFRDVAVQAQHAILRQVVEERCRFLEEERQPVLDTGSGNAVRDILVDSRAGRVAFEDLPKALAESRASPVVKGKLARRQQTYLRHRIERALVIDVEGLDALDFVVEKIEAVRQR